MAPRPWWRSAIRNLSLKGFSLGLERVCRFVVVVASARVLGQTSFGRFVFASTVTALLALGTDLGLGVWTTRSLARDSRGGHPVVRLGLALRALASIPYAIIVALVATLAVEGETSIAIVLLGVAALVNAFVDHFSAILRGYERFGDDAWLNASRALFTTIAGLVALTMAHSLAAFCFALAAAGFGAALHGLAILRGYLRPPGDWLDRALARVALRESLPIWFAGLLSLLYFKVDTLLLRPMAGDAELGAYGAAYRLFEGTMMAPSALLAVMFPQLARTYGDLPARRRLERRVALILAISGLFVAGACAAGGPWLVQAIFGGGFARSVTSLRVLALGIPIVYLNYGLTHFLLARDLGRMTTWLSLMMLFLTVALDLTLIPRAKGPGAAWATVLSEIALTAGCFAALNWNAPRAASLRLVPGGAKRDKGAA